MSKKYEFVNFKIDERNIKSQFIVYRDFEIIDSKIKKSLIGKDIKNIFLAVMN